jgi:hypothetical protein
MPDKKQDDQRPHEGREHNEGRSILVEDQTSFIDEGSRTGKQFSDGRKVANLDRVGAMSPDADGEETEPTRPAIKPK